MKRPKLVSLVQIIFVQANLVQASINVQAGGIVRIDGHDCFTGVILCTWFRTAWFRPTWFRPAWLFWPALFFCPPWLVERTSVVVQVSMSTLV